MVERISVPSAIVGPGMVLFWLLLSAFLGVMLVAFPEPRFEGSLMQVFMKDRKRGIQ